MESHALTRLRWSKYSGPYRDRLLESGSELHRFLKRENLAVDSLMKCSTKQVDEILNLFVAYQHRIDSSKSLRIAKHGVLYAQLCRPGLRHKLQCTWSSLKAWEEQKPSSFRPPLPLALLIAITCKARQLGFISVDHKLTELWWRFSALLQLGFFAMLRPGELLQLKKNDIGLPNCLSLGSSCIAVRLVHPKNSRQMGIQQFALLRHPDSVNWMVWLVSQQTDEGLLWKHGANKFRKTFREVCSRLKLHSCRFSPASLRAGGATWRAESTDIGSLRFEGRWSNVRSLEHYVQVARAQQLMISIPDSVSVSLSNFISEYFFMLALPKHLRLKALSQHFVESLAVRDCPRADVVGTCRVWGRFGLP